MNVAVDQLADHTLIEDHKGRIYPEIDSLMFNCERFSNLLFSKCTLTQSYSYKGGVK